jgi:hypothetical protein
MEIIIAIIVVLAVTVWFYSRKPKELVEAEQAPYKMDAAPVAQAEINSVGDQASQAMVESTAPAKKPRAPRKPKAETAKKPAAKKTTRKPKAK